MNIISFDVSKKELVGVRINHKAQIKDKFIIPNNIYDINSFLQNIKSQYKNMLISSESTANYHRMLAQASLRYDIPFRLINPILTKQFTRVTIRNKKTDLTDALIIAKLTLQGEGTLVSKESFAPLKTFVRTMSKLSKIRQMLRLMQRNTDNVLPNDDSMRTLLTEHQTHLKESINTLNESIMKYVDIKIHKLLTSIVGIGPYSASSLIAEIGIIDRFPRGKSLVAYAGLDPKVRQSGVSLHNNTRLTKRGSAHLRKTIYFAAMVAVRHDPELRKYHEKKMNEGKKYKEATIAVARKLLYRVYAVWKRGTPYVKVDEE